MSRDEEIRKALDMLWECLSRDACEKTDCVYFPNAVALEIVLEFAEEMLRKGAG